MPNRTQWNLGGLTEPDGKLCSDWRSGYLVVPAEIRLGAEGLIWNARRFGSYKLPGEGMLDEFVALADSSMADHAILKFARHWGVLGICEHGRPSSHDLSCDPIRARPRNARIYWEPLVAWIRFAKQAKLMLDLAAELNQGRIGTKEHWRQLCPTLDAEFKRPQIVTKFQVGVPAARTYLAFLVSTCWVEEGKVSPLLMDTDAGFRIAVLSNAPYPLFGALACELMLAVAGIRVMAVCSACGRTYPSRRRVRQDRDHFCEGCGRLAAVRRAVQRHRAKKKGTSQNDSQTLLCSGTVPKQRK